MFVKFSPFQTSAECSPENPDDQVIILLKENKINRCVVSNLIFLILSNDLDFYVCFNWENILNEPDRLHGERWRLEEPE